jgi:hypothetical protein
MLRRTHIEAHRKEKVLPNSNRSLPVNGQKEQIQVQIPKVYDFQNDELKSQQQSQLTHEGAKSTGLYQRKDQ